MPPEQDWDCRNGVADEKGQVIVVCILGFVYVCVVLLVVVFVVVLLFLVLVVLVPVGVVAPQVVVVAVVAVVHWQDHHHDYLRAKS
jgi:hypothetical protein